MTENTINNPLGLSHAEKPYYDMFVKENSREPKSFAELMGYAVSIQESNKKFRQFWGGVFGL